MFANYPKLSFWLTFNFDLALPALSKYDTAVVEDAGAAPDVPCPPSDDVCDPSDDRKGEDLRNDVAVADDEDDDDPPLGSNPLEKSLIF